MSGVLEMMKVQLDQATQDISALKATIASMTNGGGVVHTPTVDPFAGLKGAATAETKVIDVEMIMSLIEPHLENETIRKALGTEMRTMGIQELEDTPEAKYPELYARFQDTISRFQQGTEAAAPTKSTSII